MPSKNLQISLPPPLRPFSSIASPNLKNWSNKWRVGYVESFLYFGAILSLSFLWAWREKVKIEELTRGRHGAKGCRGGKAEDRKLKTFLKKISDNPEISILHWENRILTD